MTNPMCQEALSRLRVSIEANANYEKKQIAQAFEQSRLKLLGGGGGQSYADDHITHASGGQGGELCCRLWPCIYWWRVAWRWIWRQAMTTPNIEELIKDVREYAKEDAEVSTQQDFINHVANALQSQAERIKELEGVCVPLSEYADLALENDTLRAQIAEIEDDVRSPHKAITYEQASAWVRCHAPHVVVEALSDALQLYDSPMPAQDVNAELVEPSFKLNTEKSVAVSNEVFWDEDMTNCPRGVKCQLLGAGGVATYGHYNGDPFWVQWAPLPKRRPISNRRL